MGMNDSKNPTSSVKFGNIQNLSFPAERANKIAKMIYLTTAKAIMKTKNPAAAILR